MLFPQLPIDREWGFGFRLILMDLVRLLISTIQRVRKIVITVQLALLRSEQTIASNFVSFNDLPRAAACYNCQTYGAC